MPDTLARKMSKLPDMTKLLVTSIELNDEESLRIDVFKGLLKKDGGKINILRCPQNVFKAQHYDDILFTDKIARIEIYDVSVKHKGIWAMGGAAIGVMFANLIVQGWRGTGSSPIQYLSAGEVMADPVFWIIAVPSALSLGWFGSIIPQMKFNSYTLYDKGPVVINKRK